jgi:hypothetical protein
MHVALEVTGREFDQLSFFPEDWRTDQLRRRPDTNDDSSLAHSAKHSTADGFRVPTEQRAAVGSVGLRALP